MQHFRNTLGYIQTKQRRAGEMENADGEAGEGGGEEAEKKKVDWEAVDVVGGCLKMGIGR